MVKVMTWSVAITQTATSTILIIMHIVLVKMLKKSQKNIRKSKSEEISDVALIFQLIVITTSNIVSWFPANGVYIAAIFLNTYPIDLIIWTTVIGLPLNSIINPSVFIITSIRKHVNSRKKITGVTVNQAMLKVDRNVYH